MAIWLVVYLLLRKMMEFVSRDYYSIYYGKIWKIKHVPNHQPAIQSNIAFTTIFP
jgi:hypothetical protein